MRHRSGAKAADKVIGVELEPQAVADAQENARRNRMDNVEFLCADAGSRPDAPKPRPDPGRGGGRSHRKGLNSCDPATLAGDVTLLGHYGYRVEKVKATDMFPRCDHAETVVLMSRGKK